MAFAPLIGLGSLWSPLTRENDDAAGFASCCGPASCSAPLRRRPLDRRRGLRYRGPWRLPGPDFHRLAVTELALGHLMSWGSLLPTKVPELLDTHQDFSGGGDRDRTGYLLHAMQALYQLSYAPEGDF